MLYHLLYPLHTEISVFNVFRYLTVRTAGSITGSSDTVDAQRMMRLLPCPASGHSLFAPLVDGAVSTMIP